MSILNFWKKNKSPETKQEVVVQNYAALIEQMINDSYDQFKDVNFNNSIDYYKTVAPLAHAIDLRAETFAQIPIVLKDKNKDEYIYDHPVLDLLNHPNVDFDATEFKVQLASFYDLTGNIFISANGRVENAPLELYVLGSQYFNINASQVDGYAETYDYNSQNNLLCYKRNEVDGKFRFYTHDKLKELWHIKKFNPNFSSSDLFGQNPIAKIASEAEQYARASNHNLNMLKNGARLSALLMYENNLNDDQYQRLKNQLNDCYAGDSNTGKMMIAEGGGGKLDLKEMSQTNRDMDYRENKKDNKAMIYLSYKIPLPLVSPDHMTISNYKEAKLALYDEAVLPLADKILNELTNFLVPRYDDIKEGYKLTYNPQDIIALEYRSNENMKVKKETGAFSLNEIRRIAGYEERADLNDIYQAANLVPVGSSQESKFLEKARFIKILKRNNTPQEVIDKHVNEYY